MKIDDNSVPLEHRERMLDALRRHGELLREHHKNTAERAERFLLLTNAGGVVTTISFMGALPELRSSAGAWNVLAAFVVGVVLCGILAAINYHTAMGHFQGWMTDLDRAVKAQIDMEEPAKNLNAAIRRMKYPAPVVGWLAFFAFIIGLGLTFYNLRPHAAPAAVTTCCCPRSAK